MPEKRSKLLVVVVNVPFVLSKLAMTERMPVPLAVELTFVKLPVVVAVPDPTLNTPLF